jgi:large subunit ribosomal protein L5
MNKEKQEVKIEKVVLSIGSTDVELERGVKLLELLSGKKVVKRQSRKRIPSLGVRPGLEVGCMVTLRGKKAEDILRKLLAAIDNQIKAKQISPNSFSFGIKEYIEIPGMQYQRDIGILGLDVSVSFCRAGKRVRMRKIKRGKLPKRQQVSKEEISEFLRNKLGVEVI